MAEKTPTEKLTELTLAPILARIDTEDRPIVDARDVLTEANESRRAGTVADDKSGVA